MQDNPMDQELLAFPPSFAQQRLWLLDQLTPGSVVYNITIPLRLTGMLSVAALERSLNDIVERHEVLRTTFRVIDGDPVQVVNESLLLSLPITDLTHAPSQELESRVARMIWDEASLPFDLQRGPLFRASLLRLPSEGTRPAHVLLLSMHHIISDAWSLSVLVRELTTLYTAHLNGQPDPLMQLPELPIQYADFSVWQREHLAQGAPGGVLEQQLGYWKEQLADLATLELPTDRPRPPVQSSTGLRMTVVLPKTLNQQLQALSQREGVTLFMTLLAGFATLLHRYTGQTDIAVGTPIANRTRSELKNLIGFFVNTLVLRTDLAGNPTFRELLQQVRQTTLDAYAHQDVPFEKLVEELQPERDPSRTAFFQVMLALQNTAPITLDLPGLHIEELSVENGTAKFDLTVTLEERANGLLTVIDYNTDLFDTATIERLVGHWETLLTSAAADPDQRVRDLSLLTATERQQILGEWNATARGFVGPLTLHGLVEAQVARTPAAVALRFEDQTLTYAQLEARANQLAHHLRGLGVGPETRVGVGLERSLALVVALLGVLKAGAAYVPLDPAYPSARLQFMAEDAQLAVLLTQQPLQAAWPSGGPTVLALDADWPTIATAPTHAPAVAVDPAHPAYVLYTSGSTGQPKGAVIAHGAIVNHMQWMQQTLPLGPGDRVLQKTPISFDASVWEFYAPLGAGAELVLARPGGQQDAAYLVTTIQQQQITILQLVPTLLRLLTEEPDFVACTSLRRVFCGGEALLSEVVAQFQALLPTSELHNLYGPTEVAIDSTSWRCGHEAALSAPIGRPVLNTTAYVLDAQGQPVPQGVPGELYLGGAQLARGYLRRPALTADKFVPDPFSTIPGSRLYRTGDRVRWLAEGVLEFIGRVDYQVKLRGQRIELGEIEALIRAQDGVREAVVLLREDRPGDQRLVAYVEREQRTENREQRTEGAEPGSPFAQRASVLSSQQLRTALQPQLPAYMLPSAFVVLDALPLTPNGKLDRRALPVPDDVGADLDRAFVVPRDTLERQLAQVWEDLLNVRPIGLTDNFFALGGHSLLAMRLIAQIQRQFDRKLPLATLFQAGTVEQLAALLRQQHAPVSHSPLIRMQVGDGGQPFFCIHPVGGHILCYLDLVRQLSSEQSVYGLQAPGLESEEFEPLELPEIAAQYVAALRTVQPEGPYLLGGWSFGGVVAFEMAQQLQRAGQEVDLLALIDSYPTAASDEAETYDDETPIASFAWYLRSVFDLQVADEALRPLDREAQLQYILERARQANIFPPNAELAYIQRLLAVFKANMRAVQRYTPQPYSRQITLFRASQQLVAGLPDPVVGWSALAEGRVELHMMPGDHVTMLRRPQVQTLAAELQRCVQRARYAAQRS